MCHLLSEAYHARIWRHLSGQQHKDLTWQLEQQALSLSICFLHWLWSKLFFDKHSWMRPASVLQGSLSDRFDHPNIFIGPHESGVPVSFPMLN